MFIFSLQILFGAKPELNEKLLFRFWTRFCCAFSECLFWKNKSSATNSLLFSETFFNSQTENCIYFSFLRLFFSQIKMCSVQVLDWICEFWIRRLAPKQLVAVNGLNKICKWVSDRGLKRAAVTNAPRANAELMISILGLTDFFQAVVIGSECERAKPAPDPYLKALKELDASPQHAFVFEVCLLLPTAVKMLP